MKIQILETGTTFQLISKPIQQLFPRQMEGKRRTATSAYQAHVDGVAQFSLTSSYWFPTTDYKVLSTHQLLGHYLYPNANWSL